MRILQLGDLYSFHTIRWHRILKNAGYEVLTAGFEPARKEWEYEVSYVRPVVKKRPLRYLIIPSALKNLYKKFRPDMVIAHMIGSYGYVAFRIHKGKIIMVGWGPDILLTPFKSHLHRNFLKIILKQAALIVVDSNNMLRILKKLGINDERIRVFPYGPEKKWYIFPKREGITRPLKMVSHRKLEPEYDPLTILNALRVLKDIGVDFRFVFASFGTLRRVIESKISEYGLSGLVHVTGYLPTDSLIRVLRESDVYISASLYDSTSVSLLEAMAVGLYPVVSDVEANKEWIIHEKNGIIFKKGDYNALVMSLKKVLRIEHSTYIRAIDFNYSVLKKIGSFEDNVLKTVESVL